MRRRIFWIFLVVLGSTFLGATVFRDQVAQAVGSAGGSAPVTEQNVDANGFIRVHEQGTVPVTGTLSISSSANTVNLGSSDHNLLDSSNTHLASIDSQTSKLKFDSDGNLKTTTAHAATNGGCGQPMDVGAGDSTSFNCGPVNASLIVVGGFDDSARIRFRHFGFNQLVLAGGGDDGSDEYVIPLSQPIPVDSVSVTCDNFVEDCKFFFAVNGSAISN